MMALLNRPPPPFGNSSLDTRTISRLGDKAAVSRAAIAPV